jgi:hypothetical protein
MKKRGIIGIMIAIIIIFGFYASYKFSKQGAITCAQAGYFSSNPSLGPNDPDIPCCTGLIRIGKGNMIYDPTSEDANENGCVLGVIGSGTICSDCGNGNCEEWEDLCTCPSDCKE